MKDSIHLSADELAAIAVSGADAPDHVAGCPQCSTDLAELRELVGSLTSMPKPPERLVEAAKIYYRKRRALDALIEKLAGDPAARAKLRANPSKVIREAGLEPSPDLIKALTADDRRSSAVNDRIAARLLW